MNAHVAELLSALGPGLCYGLGALALFGMRALFKSFESVLQKNVQAHNEMLERINEHDVRLGRHNLRLETHEREQASREGQLAFLGETVHKLGERVARVEARLGQASRD